MKVASQGLTYKEQHVTTIVATLDGCVFVPRCLPEIDIVISPRCVLDGFIGHLVNYDEYGKANERITMWSQFVPR